MLVFEAGLARATVDPGAGGRLASLTIAGHDVLVPAGEDPMRWGSYPMTPFAGRIRGGRFAIDGSRHELPQNLAPHAIHGYGYTSAWDVVDHRTIRYEHEKPWPFAGRTVQTFDLDAKRLVIGMRTEADEPQPVMLGWHPWFRRDIGADEALKLLFGPARMYELDEEAIPTGRLVDPSPGPWDNCFTELEAEPVLRWGSALEIRLSSSADHWVVFTQPAHAMCVEPQTDAPDAVNRGRTLIDAGESVDVTFTMAW